ncbi:MAG TPA: hypothetical protein VF526_19800 [Solirubrobacteraceae bacterium]|jgi:hypothetical protein
MATQSLLWTTLPNGLSDGGKSLRVSVMLAPRLEPDSGDPPLLSSFPEWLNWPAALSQATVSIHYGAATVAVPMTQLAGANRVDGSLATPDPAVWTALFKPHLRVRGAETYTDHTGKQILSFGTTDVHTLVEGLYTKLAQSADGDLPTVTDLWTECAGLAETVNELDGTYVDPVSVPVVESSDPDYREVTLRDIDRQFNDFKNDRLANPGAQRTLATAQLFHTPPSKLKPQTTHRRGDDERIHAAWREHAQTRLDAAKAIDEMDFHQIVGAMNQYPTLLRKLGLVIDLALDRASFAASPDAPLWATVSFPANVLKIPRKPAPPLAPDVSPRTHAVLTSSSFSAHPDPIPQTNDLRLQGGLLALDPKQFALVRMDVDGAALKLMNFLRTLWRIPPSSEKSVDPITRKEKQLGAPALRTAGLMLVQKQRAGMLKDKFAANKVTNQIAQAVFDGKPGATAPALYAEDLLRGFRFDLWDNHSKKWRSLYRRTAAYHLEGGLQVTPPGGEEEGTARLAATKSADGNNHDLLWLHEAVVSWTGWSLAARPPGRAIIPDDTVDQAPQTEASVPPGLDFSSRFQAVAGSLPRLRFGRDYRLRARAVDLAGNSLPATDSAFTGQPQTDEIPFMRYEPVVGPAVALVKRKDDTTERPAEGESMHRMAIRSFNDDPVADGATPSAQVARRFAVPQQVTVRDAELHGKLDAGGKLDAASFELLVDRDRDAHDPDAALIEEMLPMQGPTDLEPVPTTFAVYRDGMSLTYLPDPLAETVGARVLGHPQAPDATIVVPLYAASSSWPDARPFKIELVDVPGTLPSYDKVAHVLRIPLAKGDRATLRLSMKLSLELIKSTMAAWGWLVPSGANPQNPQELQKLQKVQKLATEGRHWMLTPWTTVELVHAVQRPLIAPAVDSKGITVVRTPGATSATIEFMAWCSIKSTDRIDVRAVWNEPSDDPAAKESEVQLANRGRDDTAFSMKITGPDDYQRQKLPDFPHGGVADHAVAVPENPSTAPDGADLIDSERRWSHEFYDTRYRRVEYWLEGTTKFREYLPADLLLKDPSDPATATDEHIKAVGPKVVTWVPNSAAPPAPEVLYVVPTFGWVRTAATHKASSWRRGGGLRVYLDRPWNVSGYGEMLAVVLAPATFTGDPNTKPAARPYKTLVTQWGNDPIWASPWVTGRAPKKSAFPLARTAPDSHGGWLPRDAGGQLITPLTEAHQPPRPWRTTQLGAADAPVDVAPHDVFFDHERRLWYCDIEIDQGTAYWPFVRLALARYQPASLQGQELSEIVLTDFMPLTADRWLTVGPGAKRHERHVSVQGVRYTDSSANYEVERVAAAPAGDQVKVVDVAKTPVVEVWVEQLDPAKGDDFGWERVVTPVTSKSGAPQPVQVTNPATPSDFVAAPQILRARQLNAERKFSELVTEGLVDKLFAWNTLWEGSVVVPDAGPGARLRLVVAEYEEYLVDEEDLDRYYNAMPEAKGRRLVFIEYVDLA